MDSVEIDGEGARDEWGDADFEIPDGHPLIIPPNAQSHAATPDGGDDDWDIEMSIGKTADAGLSPGVVRGCTPSIATQIETAGFAGTVTRLGAGGKPVEFDWDEFAAPALLNSSSGLKNHVVSLTPRSPEDTLDNIFDWDADEERTSTIKLPTNRPILIPTPAASLPSTSDFTPTATAPYTPLETITALPKLPPPASDMEDDFEADFDLPVDVSQLSLRPLHQSTSRGTVGSPGDPWLDYASMSTTTHSSETSSLGFGHHASPSTSAWSGGTETDEDDYAFLDGVVVPDGMFDKENKANLTRLLETKKKTPAAPKPKHVLNLAYIENDDFLDGLVLDDSADLSSSKLNKRTTPPRASNRPPAGRSPSGARSLSVSPAIVRPPSRTATLHRALSPSLSGISSPPPHGLVPGRRGATSPTPTRAAGALLTRLRISSPPPPFDRKSITPSTSTPNRQWPQGGKVNGPRPPTTKRQVLRKGSLQSLVDSVAEVFSDSDAHGVNRLGFDRHLTGGSTSRPVRPTLAPSYSAVTVASTSRASYNAPTAASRARSALGMHDRDGAASEREGRGFGMLSPDQQRWIVPSTRPNTPTQNTAAVRLQGYMRPTPGMPTVKNMFLNASTTSNSSVGSSWSNIAIAPSKSAPAPVRSFAAIVKSPPLPSSRVLSPISPTIISAPKRPRAVSSLANARVTVPLPAGAVEVKRPRRPRAPSGIWGDGTELDALDDLNIDPTREWQFQVQAKGVNEGGTVKRFDDKGKGRATPVGTRTNVSPNAKAPANGMVDLSKFREPDLPKKWERERKPSITPHPPPVTTGSTKLLQVPGRKPNPKRKRERGPPPPKRPNLIRNMNGTKAPKVVGDMFFNPKALRWEGNEQILRDFDAVVASSSRPALITNLSGQGPTTPVNGQSSATTPKVVGSMLFDPIKMCWVHQLGDEFEEDPFAAIDALDKLDEEEGEGWATMKVTSPPSELGTSVGSAPGPAQRLRTEPSPARIFGRTRANTHHTQSTSELESVGGSDRGSRMYSHEEHERLAAGDVDQWDICEELLRQCQEAEERHKAEVKGWILPLARRTSQSVAVVGIRGRGEDRGWLHDIREVAMKTYPT